MCGMGEKSMDWIRHARLTTSTLGIAFLIALLPFGRVSAATLREAERLLHSGDYERCIAAAQEAIDRGQYAEPWQLLKIEAEMALGRYLDAAQTVDEALRRYYSSLRLRWAGHTVYQHLGETARAQAMLQQIDALVRRSPRSYNDAASRIVLGRYFTLAGADPRRVLELFYDRVKKDSPEFVDAYLAAGELALEKHDYAVAAKEFEQALRIAPEHPTVHWGLARAYAPSDRERAQTAIETALRINPRHVPTLLLVAEHQMDSEQYDEAQETLERVLAVNPERPEAWAYRAAIAHLKSDPDKEGFYRRVALGWWPLNPQVDYLIGRELSQHYRFREGARYQRRALTMDSEYLPAKIQLSNDLLRLGDSEGWLLADEVSRRDGYNVVAHNLMQLHERLSQFRTLERPPFIVRMDPREADVYGTQVLDLLERAHAELAPKYQVMLTEPVVVEIFPRQQDFAIRTFGLPGGEGFLGVCFGSVITANSPAALGGNRTNWQSVLWHEFCHVLTLTKTGNKMPRWFSEGLSVYEERQANASWGERLTPAYRQMIMDGEFTPLSELSAAFLRPKSPAHLQFAYYESSMVIEYLVERHGFETIVRLLDDLGLGIEMNAALAQRVGSLEVLDDDFAEFLKTRAEQYAPEADWTPLPDSGLRDRDAITEWLAQHPNNFYGLQQQASLLIRQQDWERAIEVAEQLKKLCPHYVGANNAYRILAHCYREQGDSEAERAVLEELAERDDDALDVYERLCELAREKEDWEAVRRNAERALAVNPLRPSLQAIWAGAAEQLKQWQDAAAAYQAILALDPVDPAGVHYRLAEAHHQNGETEAARHHVLRALEEAPRFQAAQRLLLDLARASPPNANATAATDEPANPTATAGRASQEDPALAGADEENETANNDAAKDDAASNEVADDAADDNAAEDRGQSGGEE